MRRFGGPEKCYLQKPNKRADPSRPLPSVACRRGDSSHSSLVTTLDRDWKNKIYVFTQAWRFTKRRIEWFGEEIFNTERRNCRKVGEMGGYLNGHFLQKKFRMLKRTSKLMFLGYTTRKVITPLPHLERIAEFVPSSTLVPSIPVV